MASSSYILILLAGMIITGSSNSLLNKWQDMRCVENCDDPNPQSRVLYEQPVLQTLQQFLGQMLCFLPVLWAWARSRRQCTAVYHPVPLNSCGDDSDLSIASCPRELRGWKTLLLWIPAACDLAGSTLMNIGLLYTSVSVYQMSRGALVLFVGVFSVTFLRRWLWLYQWIALFTVVAGVSVVGYSGSLSGNAIGDPVNTMSAGNGSLPQPIELDPLVGVFFIVFAQIFTAAEFVAEEKIMTHWSVHPLVAVGYEGLFGALSILLLMPFLAQFSDQSSFFDFARGLHQTVDTPSVLWSSIALAFSIAFFNFFGLSITKHVSATTRSLVDMCRTLSIWLVSLGLGWEKLSLPTSLLQILGFLLIVYGTFLFNDLVRPPSLLLPRSTPIVPVVIEGSGELTGTPTHPSEHGYSVVSAAEHVL